MNASKKIFVATKLLLFDFELFIGDRGQKQRADSFLFCQLFLHFKRSVLKRFTVPEL
jgi:hypothetical protein